MANSIDSEVKEGGQTEGQIYLDHFIVKKKKGTFLFFWVGSAPSAMGSPVLGPESLLFLWLDSLETVKFCF